MRIFLYILSLLYLTTVACQPDSDSRKISRDQRKLIFQSTQLDPSKYYFAYDTENSDHDFRLAGELAEISGISFSADGQYLLAINDEKGVVFFLDKNTGHIQRELSFGEPGDYEGVEAVGEKIYVLRSDGTLYEISMIDGREPATRIYPTSLDGDHNVEGLAYDPARNRLLLACKKNTVDGRSSKNIKAIYAFDLNRMQILERPVLLIDRHELTFGAEAVMEAWWPGALRKSFGPSGLAVEPASGNLYLLSSPGKLLLVLNPSGQVLSIQKLDQKSFRQPEGICFGQDGTLYISSEGNVKKRIKGEILAFQPLL